MISGSEVGGGDINSVLDWSSVARNFSYGDSKRLSEATLDAGSVT